MKKYYRTVVITAIVVLLISAGYFIILYGMIYRTSGGLETKKNLTVRYVNQKFDLDTNAEFWKHIEPEKIHLYPQSARVPYGTEERELWVRAAYNDSEITFLLEFKDETEDRGAPVNPDACAILFVPADAPATAQMMGYGSKANVWHWLADRDAERYQRGNQTINVVRELVASGPGTQTPLPKQNVEGKGEYKDGKWSVVFKRRLQSNQEGEFEFRPGKEMNVAFAIWNGVKMESFSRKSIAILRTLTLEKE